MRHTLSLGCCLLLLSASLFGAPRKAAETTEAATTQPARDWPLDGGYSFEGRTVFVGLSGEPPNDPELEFYDPLTRRIDNLKRVLGDRYHSEHVPYLSMSLRAPTQAVVEERHAVVDAQGRFGFSVWHQPGAAHRPLIVLLEGADDSTRDMGFLIPYFFSHGITVLTYDQRGTGISAGNWRYTGPEEKAEDVIAALKSLNGNALIDFTRVGVWAPSAGGWVAPIVASRFPLVFMILKSAASQSIVDNVLYEIRAELEHGGHFAPQQIDAAMRFERLVLATVATNRGWQQAGEALKKAQTEPWFALMRIPPNIPIPPPPAMLAGLHASLIYDPTPVLERITTPTLALFGSLDRNVDVTAAIGGFRAAFRKAGMRDFRVRVFPEADHRLIDSKDGYTSGELKPRHFAKGYPDVMIDWLRARSLL